MAKLALIDDSAFTRLQLKQILAKQPFEIVEADCAETGLELIKNERPDLVLLDLLMPGIGGIGALKALREKNIEVPVIVITADIQQSVRQEVLSLGAKAMLNKPPNPGELITLIKSLLNKNAVS